MKRSSAVERDEYGDTITGTTTTFQVDDCAVYPWFTETEEGTDRDDQGQMVGYQIFAPVGADVRSTDVIVVDGEDCEVQGRPGQWVNPLSATPNSDSLEIRVKFVEGR